MINNIVNITDSISRGDNIETSIYTDQNWYLQNIHGFYTCLNTSYWINKNNQKYKIPISSIKFSSDLNKTSLKNINRKNIINLLKILPNKSIYDILILNKEQFIEKLIEDYNRFSELNKIHLVKLIKVFTKNASDNLYSMFNTIKLLLLGSDENINVASSLFSLLKLLILWADPTHI